MKKSMLFLSMAVTIILVSSRTFNPDIPDPEYDSLLNPVTEVIVGDNKILSIEFPEVNYEISKTFTTNSQ